MAGFPVARPGIKSSERGTLETGLDRVSRQINTRSLKDSSECKKLIDEIESYSLAKDGDERITREIQDKSLYHRLDALRYVVGTLRPGEHNHVIRHGHDETPYTPALDPKLFDGVD